MFLTSLAAMSALATAATDVGPRVVSLDGEWMLAPDPGNVGRDEAWWNGPVDGARPTPVPWIIQEIFVGYHGVAWYWRDFEPAPAPRPGTRYWLRFHTVDYLCDVYLNGVHVGSHEGAEDPLELDVTDSIRATGANRLAVRVLNPTIKPIDGIALNETPHRNKTYPYSPGSDFNYGGITDSVELLLSPPVRLTGLFVRPDPHTGQIRVTAEAHNAGAEPADSTLRLSVAPASEGETLSTVEQSVSLLSGASTLEGELTVASPRLWDLGEPYLYRVTARLESGADRPWDELSTRCGFREFVFAEGAFHLNGRRIFLKSSHTGADTPVGVRVPYDPDWLRRDLLNVKVMGFSMIRFIAGVARRRQLDLADEIGLLVYEEDFASWGLGDSPRMPELFDHSTEGMIRRDRNHPSIVMWGLLNECGPTAVFLHAVDLLPWVRSLDDTRVVMLNSGRFDGMTQRGQALGPIGWRAGGNLVPNITKNPGEADIHVADSTWEPGQFALHPGLQGEWSVVRFVAPASGAYSVSAEFTGLAAKPTTADVHILRDGAEAFGAVLNLEGAGNAAAHAFEAQLQEGDALDFVVGTGGDSPFSDTTGLALRIVAPDGSTHDVARDFSVAANPNGPWVYGWVPRDGGLDAARFTPYGRADTSLSGAVGSLANPGVAEWEDVLADIHPYQRVPHTGPIIAALRGLEGDGRPVFVSEYGVGSAIDLCRLARHYERLGKEGVEDARTYRGFLDLFLADYERWGLDDTFAGPEDYFRQCVAKMAGLRLQGINAIRANPNVVGYSLTGTQDQGLTAEGLTTTFRELKPGTVDALFEALAPLRLCLFTEPANVYRGDSVRLEAVLANEDALPPGEYPVRIQLVGPDGRRALDRIAPVVVPGGNHSFALPFFDEQVKVDGPEGRYRFVAALQRGGAATGGESVFYLYDRSTMPEVDFEVARLGEDPALDAFLASYGIRTAPLGEEPSPSGVILVCGAPPSGDEPWRLFRERVAAGATAVVLSPDVLAAGDDPLGHLPLEENGEVRTMRSWVYLKDEWAKRHPIFDGLPAGGLMDYTVYREVIPDRVLCGQSGLMTAVAGAQQTSLGYGSGLLVAIHGSGAGRIILNTLLIRENLGIDPVAERLLRNMLRFARGPAKQ